MKIVNFSIFQRPSSLFVVTRALENHVYIRSLNLAGKEFGNFLFYRPWIDGTIPVTQFPPFDELLKSLLISSG